MRENNRLAGSPVLVVDSGAILDGNRAQVSFSFPGDVEDGAKGFSGTVSLVKDERIAFWLLVNPVCGSVLLELTVRQQMAILRGS